MQINIEHKSFLKIVVKVIGYLIISLSFFYIIRIIVNNFSSISFSILESPVLSIIYMFFLVIFYSILIFLLSFSWKLILEFLSNSKISSKDIFIVYSKTNIAKYLPGNVFHLVGRNVIGNKLGLKHSELALSSFLEIILILVVVGIISFIYICADFTLISEKVFSRIDFNKLIAIGIIGIFIFAILLFLTVKYKKNEFRRFINRKSIILLLKTLCIYLLVFIGFGLILVFIFNFISGINIENKIIMSIITIYILSWFFGFITPGAPGGIGVRESLLILLLSPSMGEDNTLLAVLIHRLICILGDVFSFLIGNFLLCSNINYRVENNTLSK